MTAALEAPPTEKAPRSVVIGVMAGDGIQIGTLLDADAPISVMIDPLLKVINTRLKELQQTPLKPRGRGRWVLSMVDGTILRPGQSLTEQEIYDGDRLWLRFVEDQERRSPVIEHISTAVAVHLSQKFRPITPDAAVRVGVVTLTLSVLTGLTLLAVWRYYHNSWLSTAYAGALAAVLLLVSVIVLAQTTNPGTRKIGDTLLFSGVVATSITVGTVVPGSLCAADAVLAFGVASIMSVLIIRLTGRHLALYTTITIIGLATTIAAALRMLFVTGPVTLMACTFLACVLLYHGAPARWLAGLRLPVFPSATSQWVFDARPDLPTRVVPSPGADPILTGPESVRDVMLRSERARSFLTGQLIGLGILVIVCITGLSDPRSDRWWLSLLLAIFTVGFLILRGRSFRDRWQAIIVAVSGIILAGAVALRYIIELWTPLALCLGLAVLILVPMFGLLAAIIVPNTIYSPLFRKFVEWIEYLCLMPLFPLALWLMNTYEAIRYR